MDILEVRNLTKRFGSSKRGFLAVDNVSFNLKEGEILGVLGPNGAGKTTTIQMLLGILTPTAGEVVYFGKNLQVYREEILEKINFSSTYTNLPWDLTVRENLTFISYLYDIKDRKKRLKKIVDTFRLEKLMGQQIKELSAGQLTRVNIAKAFINYPKVLLLDEPTASLDPEIASYIRQLILEERKNFKVSIILTSHNMREVEEVSDRVIFINRGKIIADDTPAGLAKTVQTSHVSFITADGLKRLQEYLTKNNISYRLDGRYMIADINEQDIGPFLQSITKLGVVYDEISIARPTLEDYFLQKAREQI